MIEKNQKSGKKHPLSAFLTVVFFLFALTAAAQTTEVLCNDGIDNDGDGLIDCLDGNCQFAANIESGCNCYDGLDNDGDGKIDQADNNCAPYFGLTFVGENSNCSIVPPGANTPFDLIGPPAVSGQNTADTQSKVAAGDVDGNGVPDAVITSKWNSEVRLIASTTSTGIAAFGAPNFDPGDVIADFRLTGNGITGQFDDIGCGKTKNLLFEHEVLIADIDKNGRAEVFAVVSNRSGNPDSPPSNFFLIGLRLNAYGAQGLQLIPGFPVCLGTNRPGIFGIADMDGDGKAEVYLRDRIFAAENGKLLASEGAKLMSNTALWDVNVTSAPVTVDIKGAGADGNKMELIVGPKIYTVPSLTNRNPAAPGALTLWRDMNTLTFDINGDGVSDQYFVKLMTDPIEYGIDTHSATSIADVDKDGHVDVVITGALNSSVGRTTIFYWNVQKNTVSGFRTLTSADLGIAPGTEPAGTCPTGPSYTNYQNGWIWGAGRVNIGDANGDGKLDFSFMAGSHLYCVTTDAPGTNIIPLWASPRTVNDSRSGVLTVTIYDFDNDGNPEMVYRDSQELVVIDGATGTNKYWSAICQSHTYTEGPIIADVNGDGATDICVTCARANFDVCDGIQQQALGEVRLFFSNGNEWLPTRKVWNQPGYHVVNINDNLTLPFPQLDPALVFSNAPCPNGTPGPQTPLNVFLNQVPFLSGEGCPVFPAPDLSFTGDDPDQPGVDTDGDGVVEPAITVIPPICGNLDIKAIFRIINDGDLPISAAVPVSFFIGDPTDPGITADSLIHTTTLNIVNLQVGATYVSPTVTFNGSGKPFRLYIVLNNNGSVLPINPNGTVSNECRIDNNIYDVFIQPDPFSAVIEKVSDNNKCVAADPNIGELTAHIFKGDPTVPANEVLDFSNYAFQWYYGVGTTNPVPANLGGNNYTISALPEGDYSLVVTNTLKGCTTLPVDTTILLNITLPEVTINVLSDQTTCSPPNGALEAVVTGGNTGFTFEWFNNAAPMGISTATASNLIGSNYTVAVSRNGCVTTATEVVDDMAFEPDVTATSTPVENCANLFSGTVSATASLQGVLQNETEYTFDWYYHNIGDGTRGSILPPVHGTGPNRTGLAAGYYQVEVTRISTQCKSTPFVIPVESLTKVPTVVISQLGTQTSCDPANPNGRLQATAFIDGVAQDPALFTFEWFEGQNTLPANAHTSVSGVSGSIAEEVKGGGLSYTVRATSTFQCSGTDDEVALENIQYPVVTLTPTPNGICDPAIAGTSYAGGMSVSVDFDGVTVTDFTNYSFTWYDGTVVTATPRAETTSALTGLNTGYYTVVVERTDLGCVAAPENEEVANITVLPTITALATPSTNCVPALANGQINVSNVVSGATSGTGAPFTFQWYTGSVVDPANLMAGETGPLLDQQQGAVGAFFTVKVVNTLDGCSNTDTKEIGDGRVIPLLTMSQTPNGVCDPALTVPAISFNGTATGTVSNSGSYADPTFVYEWVDNATTSVIGGATGLTATGLNNGFYTTTVTHVPTGCESAPGVIEVLPDKLPITITAVPTPSTNCIPALVNGQMEVTNVVSGVNTGTGAPFRYEWYTGSVADPVNQLAGETTPLLDQQQGAIGAFFTVKVVNLLDGCSNTDTKEIGDARVIPLLSMGQTPNGVCDPALTVPAVSFNGTATGTVNNSASYADPTFVYEWIDNATTLVIGGATGLTATGLNNGFYTTTVTHVPTGCESAPGVIEVLADKEPIVITALATPSTNCLPALANGEMEVTNVVSGASSGIGAPFRYEWYTGSVADPVNVLAGETTVLLDQQQGAIGAFFTVLVVNTLDGCSNTDTKEITDAHVDPLLSMSQTPNGVCDPALTVPLITYNGTATGTVSNSAVYPVPTFTYEWVDNATNSVIVGATAATATGLNNGFYTTTVTHVPTGCESAPGVIEVLADKEPIVITALATPSTNCLPALANGEMEVTNVVSGATSGIGAPFRYEWYTGSVADPVNVIAGETTALLDQQQGAIGAFFTVLVVNTLDGCSNTDTKEITDAHVDPLLNMSQTPNGVCDPALTVPLITYNGTATGTVSNSAVYPVPTFTYEWVDNSTNSVIVGATTATATGLNNGFYTTTVTHVPTGCESAPGVIEVLADKEPIVITALATPSTNCLPALANGEMEVTNVVSGATSGVGAPFRYEWYTGSVVDPGNVLAGETTPMIDQKQGAIGAFFTVLVVNTADGCSNTDTKEIADRQVKPILTLGSTPNTFCDPTLIVPAGAPGSGTASQAGYTFVNPDYAGPQTLTYSWFDGQSGVDPDPLASHLPASTTNTIDRLAAGYYTATVTITELGCTSDPYSVEVEDELFLPVLNITDTPQTSCNDLTPNGILVTTGNELTLPASQGGPGGAAITAGYDFSYFMDWNPTPNDPSGDPTTGTPVTDVTGTASSLVGNKYYAVQVERIATGCVTTEKIFLNENIIVPVVTLGGLVPQSECDTPNGSITATVTTPAVTTTYSYYWLRENAGTTTTDADLIIAAVNGNPSDPNNLSTVNSNTHINGGLVYGRYSLVVVDNYNSCTSVPVFEDIDDNTQSDIDITLFGPPPSDCTTDGALQMRAERLFTPPVATSFTFEVFRGSPINPVTPIDYYSTPPNPPAFAGAVLETLIAANNTFINTTVAGISSDLYTVVAEDNFGCKTYESFFLPFADSHDVTFTPTDVTSCVVDNGAITMRAVFPTTGLGISNNQTDYTFTFRNADMTPVAGSATFSNGYGANVTNAYSYPASIEQCNTPGVDEDGDGKLDPTDEDCIGFMTTAGIPVGFYVLEVLDITSNCPVFKSVEIKQDALSPVISLVGTTKANTSCDTSTPDGELIVSVNSDPNDPVLTNFNIDVLSLPGPTSAATYPRNNVVAGNYTASGLAPKTYTVTALGVSTGCTTQQDFTIQDIPVVSELVAGNIALVDAEYCDATLEASAKIEVTNVRLVNGGAADLLADYDFEWYTDATLTSQVGGLLPVLQNGVNGLAANSGVVTIGDYFVVSKKARNAGGSGGIGCFSAPFQAIIEDKTAAPSVILHPFMDTSCELLGNFEGSLEVEVITSTLGLPGPDYTNPGTIRDFDYSWFSGGLVASTTNDGDRSNDAGTDQDQIPSLGANTYGILVTSAVTGCTATYSTTITKAEVPLVLADATVVDQILCGPDGSITVGNGDILVDGVPDNVFNNFEFSWFKNDPTSAPITVADGNNIFNITDDASIGAGTYYVQVRKRSGPAFAPGSNCKSAPVRKDILDKHLNPTATLVPSNDTSCETIAPGSFEGSLVLTVVTPGSGPAPATYTLDWSSLTDDTTPADGTVAVGAFPVTVLNRRDDDYSVQVRNDASQCFVNVSTTITKLSVPVIVAAVNPVDQILCSPDGSVTVTQVDVGGTVFVPADAAWTTDFEFAWYRNNPTTAQLQDGQATPVDINRDQLEFGLNTAGQYPTMGAGTYYVTAKRTSGSPGFGCISAPVRSDVLDKHVNPTVTLVPSNDTSCETNVPGFYEGSLVLTVVTPGSGPAPATYTLDWSSLTDDTTPADGTVAAGAFPVTVLNRRDDDYSVQVRNDASQCFVNVSTTITKLSVPVIVAAVNPVDQILCSPDGSVTVTQVDVGGTVFVPADAAWTTDFEFAWYRNNPTTAQLQDGQAVPADINRDQLEFGLNTAGQYPTMGAGTYYVTAKRTSGSPGFGCISAPVRSDVLDKHVNPTVQLTPADDTSCFTNPLDPFEGSIQLTVTSPGSGPAPANYTQAWSSLTNHTNPPNGAAYLAGPMTFNDLRDDTYTVRVTNNTSACFVDVSTVITKLDVPIIVANVTQQDQLLCLPDGELRVVQISVDASALNNASPAWSDFEFHWFKDDPTTARLTDGQAVPVVINGELLEDGTNPGQYPTLGAGAYYVQVKRIGGSPGNGCISAPIRKDILDKHINPTIVLTPANDTSCETVGNFEGSLRVQVTNPGSVASALYDYVWDATNPTPAADRLNVNNDQTFTGLIGDDTNDYAVTVTNDVTGCSITGAARIQKVTVPIIIANASTGDQVICNPSGFISVDRIDVGTFSYASADAEFANFEYAWYKDDPTSSVLVPVAAGNNLLDNIDLPTTMGAGTYYVTAKRFTGSPGSGCISAPLRKDIFDVSVDPDVNFSSTPNSACIGGASNGEVIALAEERDGTTDAYTFAWSLLPGVLDPATITNASPTSTVADAADGRYTLVVTNTVTGCTFTKDLNLVLDQSLSLPNIVEVSTIDPLNCFPTGSAQVVEITIGGTASITDPVQLDADFDFEWYKNAFPTNLLAGEINANLPNQLPDSYFVLVRDLLTNCESLPVEVVISDEDIIYPVVEIRQSLPAIACDPSIGTAELISTADGNDDTNANYTFNWFPSLDTTGVSFASTSTISNLIAGNYSVRVLNTVTNCRAASLFIVPDAAPQFLPLLALSTSERTRCDAEDGALSASGVPFPIDPTQVLNNYPFPYNYTAELYRGDPPADINNPEYGFMVNDPNFPTFTSNFLQANLPDGSYTVRLTDLNTGCVTIDAAVVEDGRVLPVITIVEDVPLTNCDVTRPNGQLSATADGGKIAGYAFNWFAGNTTTGTSLSIINKLIAQTAGDYTVLVRNNITGCEQNALGTITDGTVLPPVPDVSLVRGRTNCDFPNGWVTVDVDGETLGYEFNWYDDPTNTSGTSDFEGIDYLDRDVGDYGATAKDLVTGCISPVGIVLVPDLRITPMVSLVSTPSYCLTPTGTVILELTSDSVVLTTINWIDSLTSAPIGIGSALYDLPAGFYRADFETSEGCENSKTVEVKTEILSYNLVSANSDNSNDFWNIDCIQNFPNNNVKVFNRSGVKVYEADGYNNVDVFFRGVGEKGLYAMGNELPDGTYFYIIDKRDGSKPVVGYLELVH